MTIQLLHFKGTISHDCIVALLGFFFFRAWHTHTQYRHVDAEESVQNSGMNTYLFHSCRRCCDYSMHGYIHCRQGKMCVNRLFYFHTGTKSSYFCEVVSLPLSSFYFCCLYIMVLSCLSIHYLSTHFIHFFKVKVKVLLFTKLSIT